MNEKKQHQRNTKDYKKKLLRTIICNKLDNLDEMDKFLETHILPKLNQEESENLYRQITPSEIKAVIKNFQTNTSPGLEGFTGEFYHTF